MSTLATLVVKLTAETGDFVDDMKDAEKSASGTLTKIKSGVQNVGKVALAGLGVMAGAAGVAGVALGKMAMESAEVQGLRDAFVAMAEDSGKSADELMESLKRGSQGMVSQRDLMMTYNKAAQLVGVQFANELPDAMQYLSKVSAATGQDMGFLLESLTVGVGRLSPAILDNLSIQVSLSEASARAAEMFGVEADELTKAQQQAGMMSVTLEKLKANTEAMPEVTGTAAQRMAELSASFQDTKDEIGLALLPVLTTLMGVFKDVMSTVLPPLIAFIKDTLAPGLEKAVKAFQLFYAAIKSGQDPIAALQRVLITFGFGEIAESIEPFRQGIIELIDAVNPFVTTAIDWVKTNIELRDVLIALGIAVASVVVPALLGMVAAALPLILAVGALVGAVVLLRKAWESDFLGIKTLVGNVLDTIRGWWDQHGQDVIAKAEAIWGKIKSVVETVINTISGIVETVLAAIQGFWDTHGEAIKAIAEQVWQNIQTAVETVINTVSGIVETVLATIQGFWDTHGEAIKTAAESAWGDIQAVVETVIAIVEEVVSAFQSAFEGDWTAFGENIRDAWDLAWEGMKDIMENAGEVLKRLVEGLIDTIIAFFTETDWEAVGKAIIDGIKHGVRLAAQGLIDAAEAVVKGALDAAKGLLGIESPSQVFAEEVGKPIIQGIIEGMKEGYPELEDFLANIFSLGRGVLGLGGSAARLLKGKQLAPLADEIKYINKQLDYHRRLLRDEGLTSARRSQIAETMVNLQDQLGGKLAEEAALQQKLARLEEQRAKFGFLQEQLKLLDTIRQYGLNAKDILGDLKLGAGASLEGVVGAMSKAMGAINKELSAELVALGPGGGGMVPVRPGETLPKQRGPRRGDQLALTNYGTINLIDSGEEGPGLLEQLLALNV